MVEDLSRPHTRQLVLPEALAEALAYVPGYRSEDSTVAVSPLSGGNVNRSYRVSTPHGQYVLRLSQGPDAWLTTDRSVERLLHRIASEAGLAPRIVHATDGWLITEYVSGRQWNEVDFANPEHLVRLGNALGRLHELPAPECGRFDVLKALEGYAERIEDVSGELTNYVDMAVTAWRVSGAEGNPAS